MWALDASTVYTSQIIVGLKYWFWFMQNFVLLQTSSATVAAAFDVMMCIKCQCSIKCANIHKLVLKQTCMQTAFPDNPNGTESLAPSFSQFSFKHLISSISSSSSTDVTWTNWCLFNFSSIVCEFWSVFEYAFGKMDGQHDLLVRLYDENFYRTPRMNCK